MNIIRVRLVISALLFVSVLAASPISLSQTFTPTGTMTTPRWYHTATLLNDGQVLIVGGWNSSLVSVNSAELYNPATGTFTATGSMLYARVWHTATLLDDGTVLIVGGSNSTTGAVLQAEIYNPTFGAFLPTTGTLPSGRIHHTATLLDNGQVLIAGGSNLGCCVYATAELYNPATGLFTATASMKNARTNATATALGSGGQVLIAGGVSQWEGDGVGGTRVGTAELYTVFGGGEFGFIDSGDNISCLSHLQTATLVDTGQALYAGGNVNEYPTTVACLYTPGLDGAFASTGSMNYARYSHTATLLYDGTVLVAGGLGTTVYLSSAEIYNPTSGAFTDTGSMATARDLHTATLLNNGDVLIAGGVNSSAVLASAELYKGPPPATGILYPAYRILSIIYAAPGNKSSDGYTNTTTTGSTISVGSNFAENVTTTYGISGSFLGIGGTLNWTFGNTTTQGNSAAVTDTISQATGIANASNSSSPNSINHQNDLFIICLNPAVSFTQTGPTSATYSQGTQYQTTGDPNPGTPEALDAVEVYAQAMMPNAQGVTTVPAAILAPQSADGQTLPGLGSICANHPYYPNSCTLANQCGCTPSDFTNILNADVLLNYTSTESPLNANTSSAAECTNPASSATCRFVPIMTQSNPPEQVYQLLSGPDEVGGNTPVNSFVQSDSTQLTTTLTNSFATSVGYNWNQSWKILGNGLDMGSSTTFTWTSTESTGETNGEAHSMNVSFSSSTVGCYEYIYIYEDTAFHTYVFQQEPNNSSCP
jgi:Galactose oxidase, central domain